MSEHAAPVQVPQAPVPQAPEPNRFHLQRKCACGSYSAGGGECDKCRKDGTKLQRTAVGCGKPESLPSVVHDVLGSPGHPLDANTRAWMEPRFGYDFSNVRLHTDTRAAESAHAVHALAYTVGRDVVFGAGHYAPGTEHGRRLLAHELTHVVQQESVGGSASQFFKPISDPSDSAEVEADAAAAKVIAGQSVAVHEPPTAYLHGDLEPWQAGLIAGGAVLGGAALLGLGIYGLYKLITHLSPEEKQQMIATAKAGASSWVRTALRKLNAFVATPTAPNNTDVTDARTALNRHFHATDAATATAVRDRVNALNQRLTNWARMSIVIHDDDDLQCKNAGAYVPGGNPNQIVFCPKFFDSDAVWRVEALIHELAHTLTGGASITDRGYQSDRVYPILTTAEALTNAESFALLVQDLGASERSSPEAPKDTGEDCPADWKQLLDVAIARGQRWNRNALTAVADRRPAWITSITSVLTTNLGGTTPALLDAAREVYEKAEDKLDSAVEFECEPEGGGRCDTAQTYWYGIWSDFHICPAWKAIGSEDDRVEALLAGFYGYEAGVSESAQRRKYSRLARCLTHTTPDWQTPGAAADPVC